jgi:large subunit ribosomal protein L25
MGLIDMTAYPRSGSGKNENRRTRVKGRTPAVIYGNERETSSMLEIDTRELTGILRHAGLSPLFNLTVDGEADTCIAVLREIQAHPVTDEVYHMDLLEIPSGVPVQLEVGLDIQGDNKWASSGDAVVDVARFTVEVLCRPRQVPESISVDYSELEIGDRIMVGDLKIENGEIVTDPEEVVLKLNLNVVVEESEDDDEGEAEFDSDGNPIKPADDADEEKSDD